MKRFAVYKVLLFILTLLVFSQTVYSKENIPKFKYNGESWELESNEIINNQSVSEINQNDRLTFPETYDLRNLNGKNYISPVKQQGQLGTCWAFASASVAETSALLKDSQKVPNLSEKSLAWFAYQLQGSKKTLSQDYEGCYNLSYSENWRYEMDTQIYNSGGNFNIAEAQMSTWNGASTEKEIPYCNANQDFFGFENTVMPSLEGDWSLPYEDIYQNAYHMQDSFIIPKTNDYITNFKKAMLDNGALYLSMGTEIEGENYNPDTFAQYCPTKSESIHAVTIVGWDDNFSSSNFTIEPPGSGAWIIKNSWGSNNHNNGYFYLSYYDQTINYAGAMNVETKETGFSYDKNYQYDFVGDRLDVCSYISSKIANADSNYPKDLFKTANIFTTDTNETLKAVGITAPITSGEATINVYKLNNNSENPEDGILLDTVVTNEFSGAGFYTIELNKALNLTKGTKFSVVCSMYTNSKNSSGKLVSVPTFGIEFGLKDSVIETTVNDENEIIGTRLTDYKVNINSGESYIYGLNGTVNQTEPEWKDITDSEIQKKLSLPGEFNEVETVFVPGNVMIKAFTTYGFDDDEIYPEEISISSSPIYLSTDEEGLVNGSITAKLLPEDSNNEVEWTIYPTSVARFISEPNGLNIDIEAVSEGRATITATTANELVASADVIVTNSHYVCDGVDIMSTSPDFFTIIARNVIKNPAYVNLELEESPQQVSVFSWSETNQSDINAKLCSQIPETNDWIFEKIPINNNEINNYFINASNIKINMYASNNSESNGDILSILNYNWVSSCQSKFEDVAYIAYTQNIGFNLPTVFDGEISGKIDNPYSNHLEGFRISATLDGQEISSEAYISGIGWQEKVNDGEYCGTMHKNLPIEAIRLNLEQDVNIGNLTYRVYLRDSGWSDWISSGNIAGIPDSGNVIQAIEAKIEYN